MMVAERARFFSSRVPPYLGGTTRFTYSASSLHTIHCPSCSSSASSLWYCVTFLISSFGVGSYPRARMCCSRSIEGYSSHSGTSFDHRYATICNSAKMPSIHPLRRVNRVSTSHRTCRYMVLGGFASDHVILRLEGRTPDGLTDYDAAFRFRQRCNIHTHAVSRAVIKPVDVL